MNQSERRNYLIDSLFEEKKEYKKIVLPQSADEQKTLLRSLMIMRSQSRKYSLMGRFMMHLSC